MQHKPEFHLHAAGKMYPAAWKQADEFRADRGVGLPKWPAWCYCPMAAWYAIVCADAGKHQLTLDLVPDVARLAALGAWRISQGIYQFDTDMAAAIDKTLLVGEMPTDVLLRLPEYSIYIDGAGLSWMGEPLRGYWVYLEWDANTERRELRLLLDTESALQPAILHMGPWTVTEAVDRMVSESKAQAQSAGISSALLTPELVEKIASEVQPIIARVLYICSDEPDIIDREQPEAKPSRPQPKRVKKGWRLFPPDKPRIWRVGETLGQQLRSVNTATETDSTRKGPKPHLRRAHWHGYWTGPREGERKFQYKWLPPMVVAGE